MKYLCVNRNTISPSDKFHVVYTVETEHRRLTIFFLNFQFPVRKAASEMWIGSRCTNYHSSPIISPHQIKIDCGIPKRFGLRCSTWPERCYRISASVVDSSESSSGFTHRMELAWSISEQPRPVGCSSCDSKGHVECKWCNGTGFFIIGDNMLCEVESKNTSCIICNAKGSMCCVDCKGTGFRAKWLGEPPIPSH